jgi:hypothetical protein
MSTGVLGETSMSKLKKPLYFPAHVTAMLIIIMAYAVKTSPKTKIMML